jgi:hypothetical protein
MNQQQISGDISPRADVQLGVTHDLGDLRQRPAVKRPGLGWHLRNWLHYRRRDVPKLVAHTFAGFIPGIVSVEGCLQASVYRIDFSRLAPEQILKVKALLAANFPVHELPRFFGGDVTVYGVLSRQKITSAGVNYLVDAFQNLTEIENFKFHGFGTGTNAESNGDTALQTELTTQYASDNVRPTGSQTEGGTANVYRTVATLSPDSGGTIAITEHGLFSQAATGGGTLWDRSVFSAVNLTAGADSLQVTHDTTCAAEA